MIEYYEMKAADYRDNFEREEEENKEEEEDLFGGLEK